MTGTKVLLILLILIVVLFVVCIVWPNSEGFDINKQSTLAAFNDLLAPFGPKFKVNELQPPVAVFDLGVQPQYNIKVLGDSKNKFRQAKFSVQPDKSCADVEYTASPKDLPLPPKVKNPQKSDDSHDQKHPNQFTFTIFEGGGTLTILRGTKYGGGCKVTLE